MSALVIVSALIVLAACATATVVIKKVCHRTIKRYTHTDRLWDDSLIKALHLPLQCGIWLWGIGISLKLVLNSHVKPDYLSVIFNVQEVGSILLLAWFLYRFTRYTRRNYLKHLNKYLDKIDLTTVEALSKISTIIIIFFTTIFLLKYFYNISLTGLWTITGAGSIIIGFAAKDTLSNFFGALMIYFNRPFSIGDLIRSTDKTIEGVITQIGWRATQLRTYEATVIYVPNSVFSTSSIENVSARTHRRLLETIGIRYEDADKLPAITKDIHHMLETHPEVDTQMQFFANLKHFSESSLDIIVWAYTSESDYKKFQNIRQDILLKILHIVQKHGAQMPFPTRTLQIESSGAD